MSFLHSPTFWSVFVICMAWALNDIFLQSNWTKSWYTWPQAVTGIVLSIAVAASAYYTLIMVGAHRHYVHTNVLVVASTIWAICTVRSVWWLARPGKLARWHLGLAAWMVLTAYVTVAVLVPIVN